MITGRYSDTNDNMQYEEEATYDAQESNMKSGSSHEEDATDNADTNAENVYINSEYAGNSDGEWEDPSPEYDIFGDKSGSSSAEPTGCSVNNPEIIIDDPPESTAGVESNGEEGDAVEHLSQEDIDIFLEHENFQASQTCSQEVRSSHTPHVNMLFDSDDAAYAFYNEYAKICGFSIKKAGNYHARKAVSTGHTRVTYLCNRSGKVIDPETLEARKREKKIKRQARRKKQGGNDPEDEPEVVPGLVAEDVPGIVPEVIPRDNPKPRKANVIEITGCQAKMVATLRHDKWVVINVDLEHNHELCPPEESKYLRSHKHMTEDEKLFIRTFNSVKLPTRKIFAILSYLRGGVGAVPYTKKYVSNVRTAIRNECSQNDMTQVLEYFRKRKEDDPRFYYNFNLEGNKVLSIFWSDGNSRKMYDLFGDCVSFDTTYKTNKYNLPFAPFVGVTGHGNNCLFACAIIQNETVDVFKWLFEIFLDCMGGKHPKTIITDQCVSMAIAIPKIFPSTVHRNCFFHIRKKAEEKCGRPFATKKDLHADFSDILRNSLTIDEFERLWQAMLTTYDVGHLKYFNAMWKYRAKFVPVFFKQDFFPFIHSTARSEGTNSVFKDNIGATYSVISFMNEYQRICESIEEREREQDAITRTTTPTYCFSSEIEIQAGRLYNRQIFYKFQKQLLFASKLHADEIVRNEQYEVYKTRMLTEKEFRSIRYVVLVNLAHQDFSCICCKFQKDGILCGHILRVLVNLNVSELPDKYFIDRWKPQERKTIRDRKFNVPMQLTEKDRHLRFTLLSQRLIDIASEGSKRNEMYLVVVEDAKKIEEKLDAMTLAFEKLEIQKRQAAKTTTYKRDVINDDGYAENLVNPDVAKPRGRPTIGRQKTIVEEFRTKQKITCSHCGANDHNIATCEFKHLDKALFQKKQGTKKPSGTCYLKFILHIVEALCSLLKISRHLHENHLLLFCSFYFIEKKEN